MQSTRRCLNNQVKCFHLSITSGVASTERMRLMTTLSTVHHSNSSSCDCHFRSTGYRAADHVTSTGDSCSASGSGIFDADRSAISPSTSWTTRKWVHQCFFLPLSSVIGHLFQGEYTVQSSLWQLQQQLSWLTIATIQQLLDKTLFPVRDVIVMS